MGIMMRVETIGGIAETIMIVEITNGDIDRMAK
jgi:hypothetical protein